MALTQMQIIQSLGDAMSWFERELNWGVPPTELRHLCGRIGELYAALITNGQLASEVNQRGYDVVGGDGERISVKTTAMMGSGGQVSFTASTLTEVDRVIVLRVNTEEMQVETLLNASREEAERLMRPDKGGKWNIALSKLLRPVPRREILVSNEVHYGGYIVRELESGTIKVEKCGLVILPVMPVLRELAVRLNVPILNGNGNALNTRQLGSQVIRTIAELQS